MRVEKIKPIDPEIDSLKKNPEPATSGNRQESGPKKNNPQKHPDPITGAGQEFDVSI